MYCKYCKKDVPYYCTVQMNGSGRLHYNPDGSSGDNTNLHDEIFYDESKVKRCEICEKKIN